MITTTPAIDPDTVNAILSALITPETTLNHLAESLGLEFDELLELIESPEMTAKIERLQRVLDQRVRLLTSAGEQEALGALSASIEHTRTSQKQREQLVQDQQNALEAEDEDAFALATEAIEAIDARSKEFNDAARSARSILAHSRAQRRLVRPGPPNSAPKPPENDRLSE
jgi:hypothetical protein